MNLGVVEMRKNGPRKILSYSEFESGAESLFLLFRRDVLQPRNLLGEPRDFGSSPSGKMSGRVALKAVTILS